MSAQLVTVREYARLTTGPCESSLDVGQVPKSAFEWLCGLQGRLSKGGAQLLEIDGQSWLRLGSMVGVVQTPCGITLEVLPKTFSDADAVDASRALLRKMVAALLDLEGKEARTAALQRFDVPLTEWVMAQFVQALQQLVQQGLRSDYVRREEELPFLRGQLNTTAQMRQPVGRAHLFHVRHDVFLPDQAANRLLRLALERVRKVTKQAATWRLANELTLRLAEIPPSGQPEQDWRAWGGGRLMARYQSIKPWCALVLGEQMPLALKGMSTGLSLLFPMEVLFESYVTRALRKQMGAGFRLQAQSNLHSLAVHEGRKLFQLKPDLVVRTTQGDAVAVLDCKWKRIGRPVEQSQTKKTQYGIQQGDLYQMLAYGCTYLQEQEASKLLYLVYPRWEGFQAALPVFELPQALQLHVVPFDVKTETLLLNEKAVFLAPDKACVSSVEV